MNKIISAVAAVLAATALAACGTSATTNAGSAHNAQALANAQQSDASEQAINQAFLSHALNAQTNQMTGMVEYLAPGEDAGDLTTNAACTVIVVLTTPEDLALYQGDPVVENPAGTMGAKISGGAACMQEAADVLKTVK